MILKADINILKNNVTEINKLIDDYELNSKNIYSSINKLKDYWKIPVSNIFFAKVEEHRNNNIEVLTIKSIINLYQKIIKKYETEYETIYYNNEFNSKTEGELQNILGQLRDISNNYSNVYAPGYGGEISYEKSNISKAINEINNISNIFSTTTEEIQTKELEIENEISKTEIYKLSEFEELDYILNYKSDTAEEVYVDTTSMENEIQKIILNLELQEETVNIINRIFFELQKNYKSTNTNNIQELIDLENDNFKTISDNFDKYITVLKTSIDRNIELRAKLKDMFGNSITTETEVKKIK